MAGTPSSSRATSGELVTLFDSVLSGDAASIDTGAGGIAQTSDALLVMILTRTSEVIAVSLVNVTVNADGGANYDRQVVQGANVTASAGVTAAGTSWQLPTAGDSQQAGSAGVARLFIPSYTATTFHKTAEGNVAIGDDTVGDMRVSGSALRWRSTAAISRMAVAAASGNLRAGSRLLIYGLGG